MNKLRSCANFFLICSKKYNYENERDKIFNLELEERRKLYACGEGYVTAVEISIWGKSGNHDLYEPEYINLEHPYTPDERINYKLGIYFGDISTLEVDAIVTSAMSGPFQVCDEGETAIHQAGGQYLLEERKTFNEIQLGDAIMTGGYNLPAKFVIHTGGMAGEQPYVLESCYDIALEMALVNDLRTIAFPCLFTGFYNYPSKEAAQIALKTVRRYLESNCDDIDLIILCIKTDANKLVYGKLLPHYFPLS